MAIAVSSPVSARLGYEPPFGVGDYLKGAPTSPGVSLFPGAPTIRLSRQSLYAKDVPWRAWLAVERTCPGGEQTDVTSAVQFQAMICLLNFARSHEGLAPLMPSRTLSASAVAKARDIVRCERFEHAACGKEPNQVAVDIGYQGRFGENLYMAEGAFEAPRVAVDRWLNSAGHRENLFRREWRTLGLALVRGADVEDVQDGVIWVNQFGDR
jgi:uncharacterized protein YkwD